MLRSIKLYGLAGLLAVLVGCGSETPPPQPAVKPADKEKQKAEEAKIEEIDVTALDLPTLAVAVGPLDDGRVMLNGPKGWFRAGRSDDYLVRYNIKDGSYPSIIVTVKDATDAKNLTADNLDEYAELLQKRLDQEVRENVTHLARNVQKLKFKDHVAVSYVKKAQKSGLRYEVHVAYVIRDGRQYEVEMLAVEATAREYEPQFLATIGAIEFVPQEEKKDELEL